MTKGDLRGVVYIEQRCTTLFATEKHLNIHVLLATLVIPLNFTPGSFGGRAKKLLPIIRDI